MISSSFTAKLCLVFLALTALTANVSARSSRNLLQDAPTSPTILKNAASWLTSSKTFLGEGTAYSDSVKTGEGFACSYRSLAPTFTRNFAAINSEQWDEGRGCGRCIKARCVDDRCTVKNKDVLVQVVDLCPECSYGDVDFSFGAYEDVTGLWPHRLNIEWEWASCAPEVDGTIKVWPKDGQNQWFTAFYLSNSRYPIKSVELNGKKLAASQFRFYTYHGDRPQGGELKITADSGAVVKAQVDDFYKAQDLEVQFPADI